MKLFNSLTQSDTSLESLGIEPDSQVTLYSCGPTVYNYAHIGNLRTFVMDDLLRRSLRTAGHRVQAVMNITDIDDKTIVRSQAEYPELGPMEALIETTRKYEAIFKRDLELLGVDLSLITFVRATDSIPQMQTLIQQILDAGFAYIADDSVYFDIAKYQAAGYDYGRLANVDFTPRARINNDEYDKHEASDFALWKGAGDGEPYWDFAINGHDLPGRPGWHIECSAMALNNLKQPIHIHSGGIDLKFPHHENEIAQVMAGTDVDFAGIFTHHNHVLVDGRKMSKSADNFLTLEEIQSKGYHPMALRLLFLQAAHTGELNFTWESLEAAQNALGNLYAWANRRYQDPEAQTADVNLVLAVGGNLENDLGSPSALAELFAATNAAALPKNFTETLESLDAMLGLGLTTSPDITPSQKQLIARREAARAAKDWAKSDELRDQLTTENLEIDDMPSGPRWRRTQL